MVTITDRWIAATGYRRHALKPQERTLLLSAIGQVKADYLRKRPPRDLCRLSLTSRRSSIAFAGTDNRWLPARTTCAA